MPFCYKKQTNKNLEILVRTIKQGKETECIQNEKEGIQLSQFTDNMMLYIKNHKESIHKHTHT